MEDSVCGYILTKSGCITPSSSCISFSQVVSVLIFLFFCFLILVDVVSFRVSFASFLCLISYFACSISYFACSISSCTFTVPYFFIFDVVFSCLSSHHAAGWCKTSGKARHASNFFHIVYSNILHQSTPHSSFSNLVDLAMVEHRRFVRMVILSSPIAEGS
jgi:hypothetical protein